MAELFGILNPTPDSFSDGGSYETPKDAIEAAETMFRQGASYIDVGAESTRPGAIPVPLEEEWQRLEPIIAKLIPKHPGKISIDTYKPEIIRRAAEFGSLIINDVTSFNNPLMIEVGAETGFRCIVSHFPGKFDQDIQAAHDARDVSSIIQVTNELMHRRGQMIEAGIKPGSIILDPGIGFGKTIKLNWELLAFAREVPGIDVMVGYSNKSFIGKSPKANYEAGRAAVSKGTKYLRVHDIPLHLPLVS